MVSVLQDWVMNLTLMQQGVLLGAMRGADGVPKYDGTKFLLRWYRRCTLRHAFDSDTVPHGGTIDNPISLVGGSYMGPSVSLSPDCDWSWEEAMEPVLNDFIKSLDGLPHHFVQHLRHGIQIVGYKHPDNRIRQWWYSLYVRLVNDEHLMIETEQQMDRRLGDNFYDWRARSDDAVSA